MANTDKHEHKQAKCDFCDLLAAMRFKVCGNHAKLIYKLLMRAVDGKHDA